MENGMGLRWSFRWVWFVSNDGGCLFFWFWLGLDWGGNLISDGSIFGLICMNLMWFVIV